MIARSWHGRVPQRHADGFHEHLLRTGIADYRAARGYLGAQLLRRDEGGWTHFLVISYWESLEAITRYAGEDIDIAVLYPRDAAFELEADEYATHYDVIALSP